jgi:hypothetical protein
MPGALRVESELSLSSSSVCVSVGGSQVDGGEERGEKSGKVSTEPTYSTSEQLNYWAAPTGAVRLWLLCTRRRVTWRG